MHHSAEAQLDLTAGQVVEDRSGIGQRPGQTVKFGDYQRVASPARGQGFAKAGAVSVRAGQAVIEVRPLGTDPE